MLEYDAVLSAQHKMRAYGRERLLSLRTFLTLLRSRIRLAGRHNRPLEICTTVERAGISACLEARRVTGFTFLEVVRVLQDAGVDEICSGIRHVRRWAILFDHE